MFYYRMFNKKKGESIMEKVNYDKLNKLSGDDLRLEIAKPFLPKRCFKND
jgi:hypothetical protein